MDLEEVKVSDSSEDEGSKFSLEVNRIEEKIDEIKERIDKRFNQFKSRLEVIKDAIEKKKEIRQKRYERSALSTDDSDSMTDIINDLKIN